MNLSLRRGSALILIMAFIVLIAVMAFGMISFVSDQRGFARNKQIESLIRQAQLSGRAHAQKVLEQSYVTAKATSQPTLASQAWTTAFAATGGTWPSVASHPDPIARQAARTALANGAWGDSNAVDLWRFESGLASPIVSSSASSPHGHDDGFCAADGTGRWFILAYLDRDLNPVEPAKASLQLRYAISAFDLSGLLLANKARYQHLTTGSRITATYVAGASPQTATTAALASGQVFAETETWSTDVAVAGGVGAVPCPQTDIPLGRTDDVNGYDALHYNTWRPIPVDHSFSAHMLMTVGCGLDDSTPRTLSDSSTFVSGKRIGDKDFMLMQRVPGNLPDAWRNQGYRTVTLNYWQFSRRFSDFLPFDQNPHPVTSGDPVNTGNGTSSATQPSSTSLLKWDSYLTVLPDLANRHPAALLVALQSDDRINQPLSSPKFQYPGDPYTYALDKNARRLGDIWNQIDLPNWLSVQQGLRLHRIATGTSAVSGLPSPPNKADGLTECWSPFGSTIDRFSGAAGSAVRIKNDWEMRYQWTPDANTAPRQVLADVVRLAVPADVLGNSAESANAADRDAYEQAIQDIVDTIIAGRPYLTNTALASASTTWSGDLATARMTGSCVLGGNGAVPPTDLGLGSGPRAEFTVLEWNTDPVAPYVVINGRHLRRFWSGVSVIDRADTAYQFRGWIDGSATSRPLAWVKSDAGQEGAEYVSGSPGSWTSNSAGDYTRIWIDPTSLPSITASDPNLIVDYPGISFTVGLSHWFRVAIRAQLLDLDVPSASTDQSMDLVIHIDPDSSGNVSGTSGLWDSDIPYCDLENALQWRSGGEGAIVW